MLDTLTTNFDIFYKISIHPLVVVVISTLLGGCLVAWLTRRWQDHRKEIEIRHDFTTRISESTIDTLMACVHTYRHGNKGVSDDKFESTIQRWLRFGHSTNTILKLYYGDAEVVSLWGDFQRALLNYCMYADLGEGHNQKELAHMTDYFARRNKAKRESLLSASSKSIADSPQEQANEDEFERLLSLFDRELDLILDLLLKTDITVYKRHKRIKYL